MVLKNCFFIFLVVSLFFKTCSSFTERECHLKVEIGNSDTQEIEPTVQCSSDCATPGKTFYYYDETLWKEYNSLIQVSKNDEGNVVCKIVAITQDILNREILRNSTSRDKVGDETVSEVTSTSSLYPPDYSQDFTGESTFDEFQGEELSVYDEYDLPQSAESQYPLMDPEYTTEIAGTEYLYSSSMSLEDHEPMEEVSESFNAPDNETKTEIDKSDDGTMTPERQDTFQEATENFGINDEYSGNFKKAFNTSEENMKDEVEEFGNGTITDEENLQIEHQVNSEEFENLEQEEIQDSQEKGNDVTNQTSFPKCSKGWTLNPDSKTCYFVPQNTMNWFDADIVCAELGGKLSIFHSQEEVNFVKENVELTESLWIGLEYHLSDNKTWRWIDRSLADFTDWAPGEPSSETSFWGSFWGYENCVEMNMYKDFSWNDERCTNFRRALCSKDAELAPRTTCPDCWLREGDKCYHFCSVELPEKLALLQCSSHSEGARLFAPEDDAETDFVAGKLKERNITSIWLGLKDIQENSDVTTSAGGDHQTVFSWDFNEFSLFNTEEECVMMSSEGKMKRTKCGQELPFVCTLDLSINK